MAGADLGNYGWGGRVCVNKGKALDRGTKCRAGGGYGRGASPLRIWKKIKIRDCLMSSEALQTPHYYVYFPY